MDFEERIARVGLHINAIKLNPIEPFTWASGYRMPIYNDNRMFLFNSDHRKMLAKGFEEILEKNKIAFDVVAGTSTSGIPPATTLADFLQKPMIYVRDKPKSHGLKNQIEGLDAESDLLGKKVILIEDLISTGGSSIKAVQAIRDAKGECIYCLSIFNYGMDKAEQAFDSLDPKCKVISLLNYDTLVRVAKEAEYVTAEQADMLADWRKDPFGWGEKRGFPKVEK